MPFCTQCGKQVATGDGFCAACGKQQPAAARPATAPPPPLSDPLAGIAPRTASILCYIPTIGWVAAVIVLISRRFRYDHIVRFHAFQGLYLFACWMLVNWVVPVFESMERSRFMRTDHLLQLVLLGVWIFMIVRTAKGDDYSLPVIGELARRSVAEE